MHRRATVRIAGAATVLALVGGGVAVAASSGADTQKEPAAPTATQPPAPGTPGGRAAAPGRPHGPRGGLGLGGGPMLGGLGNPAALTRTAAAYLGLTAAELREKLRDGRSLSEVARAEGKSVEGLQDAIVAAAKTRLDGAVDDGWLGPKARDQALERLRTHVDELVAGTPPTGGPRMRGRGRDGRDGACPPPPGAPREHGGDRDEQDGSSGQSDDGRAESRLTAASRDGLGAGGR